MMLDISGQELSPGDRVAFIPQNGYTDSLSLGIIEKLTKQKVYIKVTQKLDNYSYKNCYKYPRQVVKIG